MNKRFIVILFSIIFINISCVYAYELTYSEWSSVYPNVEKELIQSEERYLWYTESESDIKYLIKEEIGDRLVDYNDFKYTIESEPSETRPEEYEDRIINQRYKEITYSESDVDSIKLNNINFVDEVLMSEIEIIDKKTSDTIGVNINIDELNDKDYSNYINNKDDIIIEFDEFKNINDLLIKIYYKCDCNHNNIFSINVLSEDEYNIYSNQFKVSNCVMEIDKSLLISNLVKKVKVYTYIDKLYKTYVMSRDVTGEYYKELDGYIKDETSNKTFYRYITNNYLYFDSFGNIVTNETYCKKNRCTKKVYNHDELEEKETNPKTIDNIEYYFIIFIVSFILIVGILIIKRIKLNNKSSFVESI